MEFYTKINFNIKFVSSNYLKLWHGFRKNRHNSRAEKSPVIGNDMKNLKLVSLIVRFRLMELATSGSQVPVVQKVDNVSSG